MKLKRKHLAPNTYFIWRCEHRNGQGDRAGDRNDGPNQSDCDVELLDPAPLGHRQFVATIELQSALDKFEQAVTEAAASIARIREESR